MKKSKIECSELFAMIPENLLQDLEKINGVR